MIHTYWSSVQYSTVLYKVNQHEHYFFNFNFWYLQGFCCLQPSQYVRNYCTLNELLTILKKIHSHSIVQELIMIYLCLAFLLVQHCTLISIAVDHSYENIMHYYRRSYLSCLKDQHEKTT